MSSSSSFPYIHVSCPCSEDSPIPPQNRPASPIKRDPGQQQPIHTSHSSDDELDTLSEDDEAENFDPLNPRSAFSLFPIENLLYCEDCRQIRCPRCVQDEIVCWFCPSCLFEVPSSTVKSDGNRCTRNCYNCPICFSTLSVTALSAPAPGTDTITGPFTLSCNHCHWTTTQLSPPIKFDKPTSLSSQLARMKPSAHDAEFQRLKQHYAQELGNVQEDYTGSPGALTRLMGMYTGIGSISGSSGRKGRVAKKMEMREIDRMREVDEDKERQVVEMMAKLGYDETTSNAQRVFQHHDPKFLHDLKPLATLLRTKRSKRCRACRHILVKPESKVQTTRFRIRLIGLSYIPRLSLKRHDPSIQYNSLVPHKTHRFILNVTNPIFEPISVSLLTPSHIPGTNNHSRVTILCPEFKVGANTDVWEEATLASTGNSMTGTSRRAGAGGGISGALGGGGFAEVYEKGRNYSSVILEIVPPEVHPDDKNPDGLTEIPVLVKVSYEETGEDTAAGVTGPTMKEKVEYSYWCVVGLGKIGEPVEGVVESQPNTPAQNTPVKRRPR